MGRNSKIQWCDDTWNPIVGCSLVSPGCTNCYAMRFARRHDLNAQKSGGAFAPQYIGTTKVMNGRPVWTGKVGRAPADLLTAPLRWRKPKRVFVNSMGDLFHESIPDAWIDKVFAVMVLAPQHTFQVLTKRAERMREYCSSAESLGRLLSLTNFLLQSAGNIEVKYKPDGLNGLVLPNVFLGVSAERQKEADDRIPHLLATPAALRFVSCEPLLGPIDLARYLDGHEDNGVDFSREPGSVVGACLGWTPPLDWVIAGGESGPNARTMHPDWARSIRDQCAAADIPFFFKQWGQFAWKGQIDSDGKKFVFPHDCEGCQSLGKKRAGRLLDGREWNEFPRSRASAENAVAHARAAP